MEPAGSRRLRIAVLSYFFFPAVNGAAFHFDAGSGGEIAILPVAPCAGGALCIFVAVAGLYLCGVICCYAAGLPIAPAAPVAPLPIVVQRVGSFTINLTAIVQIQSAAIQLPL